MTSFTDTNDAMRKALEEVTKQILAKPGSPDDNAKSPYDPVWNLIKDSVIDRITLSQFQEKVFAENLQKSIAPGLPLFGIPPEGSDAIIKLCGNITHFGGIYFIKNDDPDPENNVIITVFKTPLNAYHFMGVTLEFL